MRRIVGPVRQVGQVRHYWCAALLIGAILCSGLSLIGAFVAILLLFEEIALDIFGTLWYNMGKAMFYVEINKKSNGNMKNYLDRLEMKLCSLWGDFFVHKGNGKSFFDTPAGAP